MPSSSDLKSIFTAGRPLVEQSLDLTLQIAALRDRATAIGLDWSQVKALLKAQIQDERDEDGNGERVKRLLEKADNATAYADMLGLAKMNEENFLSAVPPADSEERAPVSSQREERDASPATQSRDVDGGFGPDADNELATSPAGAEGDEDRQPLSVQEGSEPIVVHTHDTAGSTPAPATNLQDVQIAPDTRTSIQKTMDRVLAEQEAAAERKRRLRPHCLKPDNCGGQGKMHCHSCLVAHADAEGLTA